MNLRREPDADKPDDQALEWTSGDWSKRPKSEPPYNGIKVLATPTYQDGTLATLSIQVVDYTNSPEGVAVSADFKPALPGKTLTVRPPGQQQPAATVQGTLELRASPSVATTTLFLFADLQYGLKDQRHHVEGGILEIPRMGESGNGQQQDDKQDGGQ